MHKNIPKNNFLKKWRKQYHEKQQYCTWSREPFYRIAEKHLPPLPTKAIDIGAGNRGFAQFLSPDKSKGMHLLDGNKTTVEKLKHHYPNVSYYRAPERLPFETSTIQFVHSSHLIEHLNWGDLELLFKEISRVLAPNGLMVISTPMLCEGFYGEFSHVRPYHAEALRTALCSGTDNSTISEFGKVFEELELVYRYSVADPFRGLGSQVKQLDFAIMLTKRLLQKCRVKNFEKTGYTMVLKKIC